MSNGDPTDSGLLEIDPDVIFRRVEDELVLVKISTNEIHAVNPTGARIWEILSEGNTVDGTVTCLLEEYDGTEDSIRAEVEAFVAELQRQRFLL